MEEFFKKAEEYVKWWDSEEVQEGSVGAADQVEVLDVLIQDLKVLLSGMKRQEGRK